MTDFLDGEGERIDLNSVGLPEFMNHIQRYKFAAKFASGKVLDMACGIGYGSFYLSTKTEIHSVCGVDISANPIKYAKETFQKNNLNFEISDATQTTFPNSSFDSIISLETAEHIKDLDSYFKEILRLLKSSGVLILSVPNRLFFIDGGIPNKYHFNELLYTELKNKLNEYFGNSQIFYQLFDQEEYLKIQNSLLKFKQSKYILIRRSLKNLFPKLIIKNLKLIKHRVKLFRDSKNSMLSIYGLDFEKFIRENESISDKYKIIEIRDEIYNKLPGVFLAICTSPKKNFNF